MQPVTKEHPKDQEVIVYKVGWSVMMSSFTWKYEQTSLPISGLGNRDHLWWLVLLFGEFCDSLLSGCPQYLINRLQKFKTKQPISSWKPLRQTTLHLIFARCTGFQSMVGSNTKFLLFVFVLFLLLVLSVFLIYSRATHPLVNSNLPQTAAYCAFHLSIPNGLFLRKNCVWCVCMYVLFYTNLCRDWFCRF